ncbi:unnamed protein product [Cyprideis torosa]|uniref:Vesicle transport protein USE1 n=2 Tax=Cyprideis torosa TaxID=163714 RepID=A0A7R8ZHF5_9CRUS|nr:unnamed protein product [Cyprideis torosa]CAG0882434.1 unnamed protein product [Cyprideis torosa]
MAVGEPETQIKTASSMEDKDICSSEDRSQSTSPAPQSTVPTKYSRPEINFRRLLLEVEDRMAKNVTDLSQDWRLEAFLRALESRIVSLKQDPNPPPKERLVDYQRRLGYLRCVFNSASYDMSSGPEATLILRLAAQAPSASSVDNANLRAIESKTKARLDEQARGELFGKGATTAGGDASAASGRSSSSNTSAAVPLGPPSSAEKRPSEPNGSGSSGDASSTGTSSERSTRDALFGGSRAPSIGLLRARRGGPPSATLQADREVNEVKEHSRHHERLTDEMLTLTKSLKEQSLVANQLVKKDIKSLTQQNLLADKNQERLQVEANRLSEFKDRACKCWVYLVLICVCAT